MRLIEIATERRVTIAMFSVAIVLFGFVSLTRLNLNLLPDLSYPTLTVRTELPGTAPLEVENLVTKPIEEVVGVIKNVRQVRSVSRPGQSDVILEFLWGTNMDMAGIDVREKLDILELPLEASRPLLLRFDPSSEPIQRIAFKDLQAAGPADDPQRLRALRRFAEDRLKNDIEGSKAWPRSRSAAVWRTRSRLRRPGARWRSSACPSAPVPASGAPRTSISRAVGSSRGPALPGAHRQRIRQFVEEFGDSIIATRAGRPVYLRDVATITRRLQVSARRSSG
jgi:hydrophobic/amphiphilic exporter-1 (mainly G- bacteria), HAE1 family